MSRKVKRAAAEPVIEPPKRPAARSYAATMEELQSFLLWGDEAAPIYPGDPLPLDRIMEAMIAEHGAAAVKASVERLTRGGARRVPLWFEARVLYEIDELVTCSPSKRRKPMDAARIVAKRPFPEGVSNTPRAILLIYRRAKKRAEADPWFAEQLARAHRARMRKEWAAGG